MRPSRQQQQKQEEQQPQPPQPPPHRQRRVTLAAAASSSVSNDEGPKAGGRGGGQRRSSLRRQEKADPPAGGVAKSAKASENGGENENRRTAGKRRSVAVTAASVASASPERDAKRRCRGSLNRKADAVNGGGSGSRHDEAAAASATASASASPERDERDAKRRRRGSLNRKADAVNGGGGSSRHDEASAGSGDEDADASGSTATAGRRNIKRIMRANLLAKDTKAAEVAEKERLRRLAVRQRKRQGANNVVQEELSLGETSVSALITRQLVLERHRSTGEPLVEVSPRLCQLLKPHQVEAVQFLYDCLYESVDRAKRPDAEGSGCLLAHCMGLGKTLAVIAFLHMVMRRCPELGARTALVVCPLNTALNWANEFRMWLDDEAELARLPVHEMAGLRTNRERLACCRRYQDRGGVLIVNYDMFRNLALGRNLRSRQQRDLFASALLEPGADIVVCDEGHVLKSGLTGLSQVMNRVRTRRRVVLTGTPLQNNLMEYHTMVSFVKPSLLGTQLEFANRFVNPITNGQHSDSTQADVYLMKRRSHVLHRMLSGCVHRRDYTALTAYLPPKFEYVISVRLSDIQVQLYQRYLDRVAPELANRSVSLFADQQILYRVWTHPHLLKMREAEAAARLDRWQEGRSDEDDDEEDEEVGETDLWDADSNSNPKSDHGESSGDDEEEEKYEDEEEEEVTSGWKTRSRGNGAASASAVSEAPQLPPQWWHDLYTDEMAEDASASGKLHILFRLLKAFAESGDKTLVFSQSLLSLDIIEHFLARFHSQGDGAATPEAYRPADGCWRTWEPGEDYLRLDGSTQAASRKAMTEAFNSAEDARLRLFLISTKAGGLGVNLPAANRVVIFDVSWNPSHDIQSIFRTYRFGQTKPVYVYRLVAQGTMEEKIYSRQVTKQSLSFRVVDEFQIDRHFNKADLLELYTLSPDRFDPACDAHTRFDLPKDETLAELLANEARWISGYHVHDSLLENVESEELSEEERLQAWQEFEEERLAKPKLLQQQQQQRRLQQQQQQHQQQEQQQLQPSASLGNFRFSEESPPPAPLAPPPPPLVVRSASAAVLQQRQAASSSATTSTSSTSSSSYLSLLKLQYPVQFVNIRGQVLEQRPDLNGDPDSLDRVAGQFLLKWLRDQQTGSANSSPGS